MATVLNSFKTITGVLEDTAKDISFAQLKLQAQGTSLTSIQAFEIKPETGTLQYKSGGTDSAWTDVSFSNNTVWLTKTGVVIKVTANGSTQASSDASNLNLRWIPADGANNTDTNGVTNGIVNPVTGVIKAFSAQARTADGSAISSFAPVNADVLAINDAPTLANSITTFDNAHANAAYPLTLKDLLTKADSNLVDVDNVVSATPQVSTISLVGTTANESVSVAGILPSGNITATTGLTATLTATALVTAINANPNSLVVASNNAGTSADVTLTAKAVGAAFNAQFTGTTNTTATVLTTTPADQITFKVDTLQDHQVSTIALGGLQSADTVTISGITSNASNATYNITGTTAATEATGLANAINNTANVTVIATVDASDHVVLTSKVAGDAFVATQTIGGTTPTTTATIADVTPIMGVLTYGVKADSVEKSAIDTAINTGTPIPAGFTQYSDGNWYKAGTEVVEADTEITPTDVLVWTPQTGLPADSTPAPSFTVTAWDGQLESATAADVTFTIVNDAPVINVATPMFQDFQKTTISLANIDAGDTIDVSVNGAAAASTFTLTGTSDATNLAQAINAGAKSGTVNATVQGDVITLTAKAINTAFTATAAVVDHGTSTVTTATVQNTVVSTLADNISVTDANGDDVTVTLSVINGTFDISESTVASGTGADSIGASTGVDTLTITGKSLEAVNLALSTLTYHAAATGKPDDILTVEVIDAPVGVTAISAIPRVVQIQVGGDDNNPNGFTFATGETSRTIVSTGEPIEITTTGKLFGTAKDIEVTVDSGNTNFILKSVASVAANGTPTYVQDGQTPATADLALTIDLSAVNIVLGSDIIKFADNSSLQFNNSGSSKNLYGTSQMDHLIAGDFGDNLFGYAGDDLLDGGAARDGLYGGAGSDAINGDAGNDYISGGADSDTINGGAGNDVLAGGAGSDTFVFDAADDADIIIDFDAVNDEIDLPANTPVAITASGSDTLLTLASGSTIRLAGVTRSNVDATDFKNAVAIYDNSVFGTGGADNLVGTNGADMIVGGAGADTIDGGLGNDRFVIATGDSLVGTIGDTSKSMTVANSDIIRVTTGDIVDIAAATVTAADYDGLVQALAGDDISFTIGAKTIAQFVGTYDSATSKFLSTATNASTSVSTTDVDAIMIAWAATDAGTTATQAIVIVGVGSQADGAMVNGLLTLA